MPGAPETTPIFGDLLGGLRTQYLVVLTDVIFFLS